MEENERVRQNPPSLQYLKSQSKRLAEQIKEQIKNERDRME
jgi:hypothetical protein